MASRSWAIPSRFIDVSPIMSPVAFLPRPRSLSSQLIEPSLWDSRGAYAPFRTLRSRADAATIAADLAKKSRTPPPPRRVQAPKQRTAAAPPGRRRRLLLIGAAVALVAIVAAGAVLAAVVLGGGSADATLRDAGCTITKRPALGRQHVAKVASDFKYNTFPPTNGPHNPVPAVYDFYSEPVEQAH